MGIEVNGNSGQQPTWLDYASWCQGMNNILPFIGNVLINNPVPWVQNYFQQQWFGNPNYGQIGDQFQLNNAPTNAGGGGAGSKVKEDPTPELTDEQKVQKGVEERQKKREKDVAITSYTQTRKVISDYKKELDKQIKTLPDGNDKSTMQTLIDKLAETLNVYDEITDKTKLSKEKILEKQKALQKLITDNKTQMEKFCKNKHKKSAYLTELTGKDLEPYTNATNGLKNKSDSNGFGGILTGEAVKSWNKDIDIIQLMSIDKDFTTNLLAVNTTHKDALRREAHKALVAKAEALKDNEALTNNAELKAQLNSDLEILASYFNDNKVISGQDENYKKAFNNLFISIREVNAYIAQEELNKDLAAIGALDETDKTTITSANTQAISTLKLERDDEVQANAIPHDAKTIEVNNAIYRVSGTGENTKYWKNDGTTLTTEEFNSTVGTLEFNNAGAYKITKNGSSTYHSAEGKEITEEIYKQNVEAVASTPASGSAPQAGSVSGFTNQEIVEFFNAETRDLTEDHFDAWCAYGRKLAEKLIGKTNTDDANKAADIIFNKMNVKNIFTALAGYEDNDAGGDNIIEQLLTENNFSGEYTDTNGQKKSANASQCMKQIIDLAVANLKIQKENNNISDTAQLESDITKLEQYSSSTAILTEEQAEEIDDILHRYSNMVDEKIEYNDNVDDSKIWTS